MHRDEHLDPLLHDPRYLPYIPLIYVAWADGELEPVEIDAIRQLVAVELAPGIDELPVLASWLDPANPPTATRLLSLLRRIRDLAGRIPKEERRGLGQLGEALARAAGGEPSEAVRTAIAELETSLGIAGGEATRALLAEADLEAAPPEPPLVPAPQLDLGSLTRLLDGREHAVRNDLRDLLASGPFERPTEVAMGPYREVVLGWLRRLAEHGVGRLAYPSVTGAAADMGAFAAAFETVADFDLSLTIKLGVQFGLFGGSIYFLGTERHHALLEDVASLKLPGCFAMTEEGHGSNVEGLRTTADLKGDQWILHTPDAGAVKTYIGNAACHARLATVFAQLRIAGEGYGVHAFLVAIRDDEGRALPGITLGDNGAKMGLGGVDNGKIAFDHVKIPRDSLLDRYATVSPEGAYHSPIASPKRRFFTMVGTLVGGRVCVAAAGIAAARSALTIALRYGERRRQFGPAGQAEVPLMDYATHQQRLLPALATAVCFTLTQRALTDRFAAQAEGDRELEALAAGFKAVATWFARDTIQVCRECCGGQGYMAENRFAALKADTDVFTTFEGDNTVLMQLAARGALTAFRHQVGEGRLFGVLRHLAERAAGGMKELDPVSSRNTRPEHLRSATFQLGALRHREAQLTWSAAGRLKSRIDGGMDSFHATIECQDHLLSLGRAFIERHVVETVSARLDGLEDEGLRRALIPLRDLYALSRIQGDEAWFLRHGVLEAAKGRAIRKEVQRLCRAVRPMALQLVDAFAIPDALLGAPIGLKHPR